MARAYLVACQVQGRADFNAAYPQRLTRKEWHDSDGWLGDRNHHPPSEHLPDRNGAVRATDNDVDALPDPFVLVAAFIAHPSTRYVIYQDGIYHQRNGFRRAKYNGVRHKHVHRTTTDSPAADANTTRLRLPGIATGTKPVVYVPATKTGGGMSRFATVRFNRHADSAAAATLQRAGNKLGAGLKVDGVPGPKTNAWVRAFQTAHHLTVDGTCGPKTWAAIAQALLNRAGQHLTVDGSFGPASKAATVAVQKMYGLTADGWFGPKTIARLLT